MLIIRDHLHTKNKIQIPPYTIHFVPVSGKFQVQIHIHLQIHKVQIHVHLQIHKIQTQVHLKIHKKQIQVYLQLHKIQIQSQQRFPPSTAVKNCLRRRVFDVKPTQEMIVVTVCLTSNSNVLHTQVHSGRRRLLTAIHLFNKTSEKL